MDIKIKYFEEDPVLLTDIVQGDWVDLPLQQDLNLLGDPQKKVPLGIAMQLPKDYEAHVVPRSSTFRKFGIIQSNHLGVVDNSYNGPEDEWFWPIYILKNHTEITKVPKGTRVAQFRIIKKQPKLTFTTSDLLHNINRGGDGSTGR